MAQNINAYDDDEELDDNELEPEVDYLDDFGSEEDLDLDGLSSDVDRWKDYDSYEADRDYLYGLLR